MKNLELKIRKSNFLFNIGCWSGRKLQKRELVVMEVKNYQLLEKAKEEKVNIYRMEEYPKFSYLVYWIILG